jgi:hypothetical protein
MKRLGHARYSNDPKGIAFQRLTQHVADGIVVFR